MSVQVRNRTNNGAYVASSVGTHGEEVASRLGSVEALLPPNEQLGQADIKRFLDWLGGMLAQSNQRLAKAEHEYVIEQADDPGVREARDDTFGALLAAAIQVRDRVESVFGSSALATYGLQEPAPRTPETLQAYVRSVVILLTKHPRRAVDAVGSEFDTARAATHLGQKLAGLDATTDRLMLEKRELDAAMLARNASMTDWERVYRGVSSALAGLYLLAGEAELASRIRPTKRRTAGVDSALDEGAPEQPTGDPAPASPADEDDILAEPAAGAAIS